MSESKVLNLKIEINKGYRVTDPSQQPTEQKEVISVRHGATQYRNFIENLSSLGAISAKLVRVFVESGKKVDRGQPVDYVELALDDESITDKVKTIQSDLENAFKVKVELTPEQKELADLKAEMAELKAALKGNKPAAKEDDDEITPELIAEYTELVGSKPHHKAGKDSIMKRIEEEKAKLAK